MGARIFAVADVYDAITSGRKYASKKHDHKDARREIAMCAGVQFDPHIVSAFLDIPEERLARIATAQNRRAARKTEVFGQKP